MLDKFKVVSQHCLYKKKRETKKLRSICCSILQLHSRLCKLKRRSQMCWFLKFLTFTICKFLIFYRKTFF